jgi:FkbM family methyltransferase
MSIRVVIREIEGMVRQNVFLYYWLRKIYFWYSYFFNVPHEFEFKILSYLPSRSGEIIDVGANDGLSVVSSRAFNSTNPILSFEPNQFYENRLKWLSSRITNFSYEMVGVGDKAGYGTLYTPVYKGYSFSVLSSMSQEDAKDLVGRGVFCSNFDENKLKLTEQTCKIIRIDDLELSPILIKIDIEGGELLALKGMEETLKRSQPALILESHGRKIDLVKKFLMSLDYELVDLKTIGLCSDGRLLALANYVFCPSGFCKNFKKYE